MKKRKKGVVKKMKAFRFLAVMATITIMLLLGARVEVEGAITLATANPAPAIPRTTKAQKFLITTATAEATDTLSAVLYRITYDPDKIEVVRMTIAGTVLSSWLNLPPAITINNTTGVSSIEVGGAEITATGGWTAQPFIYVELNYKSVSYYKATRPSISVYVEIDEVIYAAGTPVVTPSFGDTGDVNGDGEEDLADARWVLEHLNGIRDLPTEGPWMIQSADVSNDGRITIYDAALLVQNAAAPITFPRDTAGATPAPGIKIQICTISLTNAELIDGKDIFQTKIRIDSVSATAIMVRVKFDQSAIAIIETKINPNTLLKQPRGISLAHIDQAKGEAAFCLVRLDLLIAEDLDFVTVKFKSEIQDSFDLRPVDADIYSQDTKVEVLGVEPESASDEHRLNTRPKLHLKMEPLQTVLLQNYPNPFNPETWIPYRLAKDSNVVIRIYNIHGQFIRILDLGYQRIGAHIKKSEACYWDGRSNTGDLVSSGVYFYILQANSKFSTARKMVILK